MSTRTCFIEHPKFMNLENFDYSDELYKIAGIFQDFLIVFGYKGFMYQLWRITNKNDYMSFNRKSTEPIMLVKSDEIIMTSLANGYSARTKLRYYDLDSLLKSIEQFSNSVKTIVTYDFLEENPENFYQ